MQSLGIGLVLIRPHYWNISYFKSSNCYIYLFLLLLLVENETPCVSIFISKKEEVIKENSGRLKQNE